MPGIRQGFLAMSEVSLMSGAFSASPSDCETVSSPPSRVLTPDVHENLFIPAATMAKSQNADPFYFRYEQPSRSEQFWFEDGSAVIEVENTWYNVHGSIMKRQSKFFQGNLPISMNIYDHSPASVQQPLVLDVSKRDFDLLLSLIYPSDFWTRHNFTVDEWSAIASIATALEFPTIRKAAFENIFEKCDGVELIDLGRKHDLHECITSGVRMLCFADEVLSLKDGNAIGMELVIQIARARELLAKGKKWSELEHDFEFY